MPSLEQNPTKNLPAKDTIEFNQGEKLDSLYIKLLAIQAELMRLNQHPDKDQLHIKAKIHYFQNRQNEIQKEVEQRRLIDGVISQFDKQNAKLLEETVKPSSKAALVEDIHGKIYLAGHGNIQTRLDEQGNQTRYHTIDTNEGALDTNVYLQKLALDKQIKPFSEVIILSCHVAEMDCSVRLPYGITAKPIVQTKGVVYQPSFKDRDSDKNGNYLIANYAENQK